MSKSDKITYVYPFAFPPKERERAKCFKGKASVYSPTSTRKFYKKIRTYMLHHYPEYINQKVDYTCKLTLKIGVVKGTDRNDLDNRIKNLDSLLIDRGRKENSGFKGIFTDDSLIKWIDCQMYYVDNSEDEFTILTMEPYNPPIVRMEDYL